MPKTKIALKHSSIASFETLVRKVRETFLHGRERVKQEMIRTYWQTGKYIHEHILHHQKRADYGKKVIPRLAERVALSERTLQQVLQVYRRIPEIPNRGSELPWRVLRTLAAIPDNSLRKKFLQRAREGHWTGEKLRAKIKAEILSDSVNESGETGKQGVPDYSEIARPKLGTLYTYKMARTPANGGELKIDQGFSTYKFDLKLASKLASGNIVESRKDADGNYAAVKSKRGAEDLFTYKAFVERVVDGDTLFVEVDLGFGNTTRQYLRLRALDAPEMKEERGRKAKDFVASLLKPAPFIFLTTTRSDKYDRYLADIFIPGRDFLQKWSRGTAVLSQSADLLYLNNALLKNKLAVRVKY